MSATTPTINVRSADENSSSEDRSESSESTPLSPIRPLSISMLEPSPSHLHKSMVNYSTHPATKTVWYQHPLVVIFLSFFVSLLLVLLLSPNFIPHTVITSFTLHIFLSISFRLYWSLKHFSQRTPWAFIYEFLVVLIPSCISFSISSLIFALLLPSYNLLLGHVSLIVSFLTIASFMVFFDRGRVKDLSVPLKLLISLLSGVITFTGCFLIPPLVFSTEQRFFSVLLFLLSSLLIGRLFFGIGTLSYMNQFSFVSQVIRGLLMMGVSLCFGVLVGIFSVLLMYLKLFYFRQSDFWIFMVLLQGWMLLFIVVFKLHRKFTAFKASFNFKEVCLVELTGFFLHFITF
ncbi:hypothetical protein GEMRC1_004762 [Eukaryota sp. GEM-RC1]